MKVFIDPGHGNSIYFPFSRGVNMRNNLWEDRYTYHIAIALKCLLPHTAIIGRGLFENPTLIERARIASKKAADLAISIHVNSNNDPTIGGLMTFIKEEDNNFAKEIAKRLMLTPPAPLLRHGKYTGTQYQKPTIAREDNWTNRAFNVLKHYKMPSLLIELGFSTNFRDLEFLLEPGTLEYLAGYIKGAILAQKEFNNYALKII